MLENYREDLVKFKVSQDSITDSIDLLSDKFVNKVTLVRTAERTIDSTDMYSKIQSYFDGSVAQYCKKYRGSDAMTKAIRQDRIFIFLCPIIAAIFSYFVFKGLLEI